MELPKEVEVTVYIELTDSNNISISTNDSLPDGWIKLGEQRFTISIPQLIDEDIVRQKVDGIEKAITKLQADTEVKVESMKETIQSLLAIEHNPSQS